MAAVIETHKIIELSDCTLETKALLPGVLLKWMDITSCLAAEKLANVPCVTLFVDDLQIDRIIQLGQIINIKAWVNRAYHTSMEVEVLVNSEDASFTERTKIYQAYFTFVTQRDENGEKNVIPPITPATETEKVKFALAGERKKIRLDNHSSLTSITVTDEEFQQYEESQNNNDGGAVFVIPGDTYCECIELVLPQHANHHQTTFGGQLMEWMEQTVSISARRLCRGPIKLLTVEEVFFRAPSKVGDRIVMKACVNKTFGKSMEVGVRVEAYAVGGPTRHIQSAYFTFISPDGKGNPKDLPKMKPMNKHDYYRMKRAETRVKMRHERRMILSSTGPYKVAVSLDENNQKILCYKNILELMNLYNKDGFKFKFEMDNIRLSQLKIDDSLCIRLECEVPFTPYDVYQVLIDHTKRSQWDVGLFEAKVVKEIKEKEDYIVHYLMHNLAPGQNTKCDDLVVLASSRQETNMFIIAYRSVKLKELPPVPEYNRAMNRCSGFVIQPSKKLIPKGTKMTYINQLTDHIYEYVKTDLKGATANLSQRAAALMEVIKTGIMNDGGKA